MPYLHGIRIQENPTSVPTPVLSEAGVPVIFGTAPVNLVADPTGAVNKLFLCNSFAEAKAAVGYSEDYDSFTLCQAMDAFFKAFGVGPIVICNVLDPATHKKAYTETIAITDGAGVSAKLGILTSGLTVSNGETALELGTDYTLSFNNDGYLVVTMITSGISSVNAAGYQIDATLVEASDIIGGVSSSTGAETGLELVRKVYPMFGLVPSLLLAPGWSQNPSVGIMLGEKCKNINGMFQCECVVDISSASGGATKYDDVAAAKLAAGYENEHMICVWPEVKYAGKKMAMSAMYAALAVYTDYNNDNVPNLSPSNKPFRIMATVLDDGTEVNLDTVQANELNAVGVVTAINLNGFKTWGNNTSAYPGVTDPKDRWIACRRFFTWWGNSFITNYLEKVDNPANYRLIESIVDSENVRGNALVSQGKCAGIRMVYDPAENPVGNVMDGKIRFKQYLAPYTPAEDILNVLEFDPTMIETALGG